MILHFRIIVNNDSFLTKRIQVEQNRHIAKCVVEPCSYNTDQQKIIKTTFQSFLDCKNGIRIILLAGKYNGLNIKMWIIVGARKSPTISIRVLPEGHPYVSVRCHRR